MVDSALDKYVKDQLARGYPEQRLVTFLVSQGYSSEQVLRSVDRIKNPKKNPWKLYGIAVTILFVLALGYFLFNVLRVPLNQSPENVDQLQALLFVSEVRHAIAMVPLENSPRTVTYNIPEHFEQVCIVDTRLGAQVPNAVILNSVKRDPSKNLFLVSRDTQFGFEVVSNHNVGAITADNNFVCVPVQKGWVSLKFSPTTLGVKVSP